MVESLRSFAEILDSNMALGQNVDALPGSPERTHKLPSPPRLARSRTAFHKKRASVHHMIPRRVR
jgi:hypothetical protein